jgi:excisionase family DNA binding protein
LKVKHRVSVTPRRIVGLQEAAKYCGVSRWTLCVWIRNGDLPVIRFKGRIERQDLRGVKVDLDDLDQFIERSKDREN